MKTIYSTKTYKGETVCGRPQIAVCFFGITRSLSFTIESIKQQILTPADELGEWRGYGHFFCQREILNPRSGEKGVLNENEHELLQLNSLELEEPDDFLEEIDLEFFKSFGDLWSDDFRSLRNMFHQLRSLQKVTHKALEDKPDIVIFARPDLFYHDNLRESIKLALRSRESRVLLPVWSSSFQRLNDRFAICVGGEAAIAYGCRLERLRDFCVETSSRADPNKLVKFALDRANIRYRFINNRASRVRFDGRMERENFTPKRLKEAKKVLANIKRRFARTMKALR